MTLLAAIARRWPAFAGDRPPERAALQRIVDDAGAAWELVDPAVARSYEVEIEQGRIPTRDGSWHDAFNVLAFVRWPRAKTALHARVLQCQRARTGGPRSREEDALALLDEAVIVVSGEAEAIASFERARADQDLRAMAAAIDRGLCVGWFGHALLEHVALQRPQIGAGILALASDDADAELALRIDAGRFTSPCFAPTVPWPHDDVLGWLGA